MIAINGNSMELIIDEPICLPSLSKSHYHYHESSGYSSKEAEYNSSPENRLHSSILPFRSNEKSFDSERRRQRLGMSTTASVSNVGSLTIDELSSEQMKPIQQRTVSIDLSVIQSRQLVK